MSAQVSRICASFQESEKSKKHQISELNTGNNNDRVVAEVVAVLAVEAVAEDVMVAAVVAAMVVVADEAVMVAEVVTRVLTLTDRPLSAITNGTTI